MIHPVARCLAGAGVLVTAAAVIFSQSPVPASAQAARTTSSAPAGPAATYVPPSAALTYGEKGAAVKSVQHRLAELGYDPGPVDGVFGQDTLEAAWAFREVQGLRVTVSNEAEPINKAFLKALVHPRPPYKLVPHGGANRIEINQNIEVLVLYRHNKPWLIAHVSTGGLYYYPCPGDPSATCGPAVTPDGNYHAIWFDPGWVTVPLGEMYNPVFFIGSAYAIHGDIPAPWFPASHGCVRLWMDIASWFHTKINVGGAHPTPIYIRGTARPYPESN
jgi:peptidoglycan hydrolase-like protein with peptidoglycan-binding domain